MPSTQVGHGRECSDASHVCQAPDSGHPNTSGKGHVALDRPREALAVGSYASTPDGTGAGVGSRRYWVTVVSTVPFKPVGGAVPRELKPNFSLTSPCRSAILVPLSFGLVGCTNAHWISSESGAMQ
jgi:hypothetical protein